jgi:hypothetical protein
MSIRATKEELEKLFKIVKLDPTRKEKYPTKPHLWYKRKAEAARALGRSRQTIDTWLGEKYHVMPEKPKLVEPKFVQDYKETDCHQKVVQRYTDKATGKLKPQGELVDRMGLELYMMFGQKDPATLKIEHFRKALDDPQFLDPLTKKIQFNKLVALRAVMTFAGIDPDAYPEFSTKKTKRKPQKRGWYLEQEELLRFIYGIQEIDTLVYARIGFEGGGRFSSTILTTTDKIKYDLNLIEMYEPKVEEPVERYFVPCTMDFIRQYCRDFNIVGKLFRWDYQEMNRRLLRAGLKAGLFRYTGEYVEKKVKIKGRWQTLKIPLTEGKKTTTHLLKHTFVSLASLHGFGLDDVSEQTGTDPSTLKKHYLGVGKKKLKAVILGQVEYIPWNEWVAKVLHPHWVARYNQLKPLMQTVDGIKAVKP